MGMTPDYRAIAQRAIASGVLKRAIASPVSASPRLEVSASALSMRRLRAERRGQSTADFPARVRKPYRPRKPGGYIHERRAP